MADNEDNYLMLSGIQHFQFCKRQWALIHIEQQWEENVRTVEGNHLHKKADQPFIREKRGDKLIVRAMPIKSNELEISGICDVVEFIEDPKGVELDGEAGTFIPYPVEYKRGKPKQNVADILQLTAQAICLEEMLLCEVDKGYLFYNETKQRVEIPITEAYRNQVKTAVAAMQELYKKRHTPKVKTGKFCDNCSLKNICIPTLMKKQSVKSYMDTMLEE
ncbi:MAG: CRISPR-associated protein Cas4 [Defluviitaleaceae bacterium]|nr:CRISPR-associated protein Cas4 [Defluviitaleaceae bacterium]